MKIWWSQFFSLSLQSILGVPAYSLWEVLKRQPYNTLRRAAHLRRAKDWKLNFLFCGTVGWEGITIYGKAFTCALF